MTSDVKWALVTGASSGLGVEFARLLAARGFNLVLVARREAPMARLAEELRQTAGVEIVVEPLDLRQADIAWTLQSLLEERGITPDVLINNAAFGITEAFLDNDPVRLNAMLQLDIVTMTELTHVFSNAMAERGRGHILLVASIAGFNPTPMMAAYGAAKAYVLSLGESLHVELAPKIGVTVLSPGLMDTGFLEAADFVPTAMMRRSMLPPARVAKIGLDALFAGKSGVVAGRLNRIMTFSTRFLSRHLQAKMGFRLMKG
jgi:short-subunit dehydrogenase